MARRSKGALSRVSKRIKKGALTAEASRAGKSIGEFCRTHHHGLAGRRCALAKTFKKYRPKGRAASRAAHKAARTRNRERRR